MGPELKYRHLLAPINLGPLPLRNRIAMAPLTRGRAGPSYTANELQAEYYAQRAEAGLVITEGTHISMQARGWFEAPEVYTPEHAEGWRLTTDAVHASGGTIFCQLWHTGRASHSSFRKGREGFEGDMALAVAPSAIKRRSTHGKQGYTEEEGEVDVETPRALTLEECEGMADVYRNAAQTAKDAGFDGVEIHCANGYLLDEFLQSCSNQRDDKYGGSHENRFRIVHEIITAVLDVYPSHRIAVRLSPNGMYNGMGSEDFREAFLYYASRLREYELGYLHVMIGLGFGFHEMGEPMTLAEIRTKYPGVIMGNVGFTPESAEKEIQEGNADMISFGRLHINNPDLVQRIKSGVNIHSLEEMQASGGTDTWFSSKENRLGRDGYSDYKTWEEENPPTVEDEDEDGS